MKSRTLLLCSVILLCVCQQAPPIDFFKEDVTIKILDETVEVTGVYFFENMTQIRKRIKFYYPFPVDSNHYFPDTIAIAYPFEKDTAGIFFSLSLRPNSIDSFKITYEQQIEKSFFKYITTTTRVWKRPIKEANFTIIAPETLAVHTNYALSERRVIDGYRHYIIQIKKFFPEEDLIITW
jgi:hypothetical protein